MQRVIDEKPEVISHNLETVRRLTKQVRIQAKYDRSLEALKRISEAGIATKSGIMLGLGETKDEVVESMKDLRASNVSILTLGQYLQPTKEHLPVVEFIHPDIFAELKKRCRTWISLCRKWTTWFVRVTMLKNISCKIFHFH